MMLNWNQYREQLLKAIGDLGRFTPQTVRGYRVRAPPRPLGSTTVVVSTRTDEHSGVRGEVPPQNV